MKILYHVAPAASRQRIAKLGVDFRQTSDDWWDACEPTFERIGIGRGAFGAPEGNYLWSDLRDAFNYTWPWIRCPEVVESSPAGMDVWAVDGEGLPVVSDPEEELPSFQEGITGRSYYTTSPVPPSRIKLLATVTRRRGQEYRRYRTTPVEKRCGIKKDQRIRWHARLADEGCEALLPARKSRTTKRGGRA